MAYYSVLILREWSLTKAEEEACVCQQEGHKLLKDKRDELSETVFGFGKGKYGGSDLKVEEGSLKGQIQGVLPWPGRE